VNRYIHCWNRQLGTGHGFLLGQ